MRWCRDLVKADFATMHDHLCYIDWLCSFNTVHSVNSKYKLFHAILHDAMNLSFQLSLNHLLSLDCQPTFSQCLGEEIACGVWQFYEDRRLVGMIPTICQKVFEKNR